MKRDQTAEIANETQKEALFNLLDIYKKDSPTLVVPVLHFHIALAVIDWLNTEVTQLRKQLAATPEAQGAP